MAQSIILKRSALQGKVPTTSSLSLGELAVNTYDGKIYLNRSGSIQSIQEIVTTNVVNTGSITLTKTGSFGELVVSQDGNFQRDLYVTRDIITNGSLDVLYDITASVVSASSFIGYGAGITGVTASMRPDDFDFNSQPFAGTTGYIQGTGSLYKVATINSGIEFRYNDIVRAKYDITNGFSSSIFGIGDVVAFSSSLATTNTSVNSSITNINLFTSSNANTSLNLFTSSAALRLTNLETTSASVNSSITNLNTFTSSTAALGSLNQFTASINAWSGSLATTGSNSFNGNQTITGSVTISGTLTANEFHTTFVSSSVLYTSGSTKFGDTGDDIMSVTGSLIVSGSQTITGSVNITGSLTTFGDSFYRVSASNAPFMRIGVNGGLYPALTAFNSSGQNKSQWINSNGTMYFDYDGVGGGNLNFRRQIDGDSNTVARFVANGNLLLQNTGSYTDNGHKVQINASGSQGALYVSGSTTMTGSLVVTNGITGSLFGTASFALNGSSNAIMYQTASAASTWVFNHFLATPYPVVTVYDNTNSVIIPQSITVNDSSSLTITFSSARTGVAVASKGGYVGSAVGTATVANALTTARLINGTSFDGTQNITIPNLVSGSTQISLAGASDYSGLFGGIGASTSSINAFTSSHNSWSGSVATTGSNIFGGNQTITGSLTVTGTITANQYNVSIVSSSVLYTSGSTKFGNTSDDIMGVTGSLQVTGSLTVNGPTTLSGSLSLSPSQSAFLVSHSISQSATVGATAYGVNITPYFNNTTSSQIQTALRVMPTFTGSFSGSNTANIIADFGATSVGSQFTITDAISGSIYMVNDISGLPIIEALSDGQVNMYDFPYKAFNKSGSYLSLGVNSTPSSSVTVQSDFIVNKGYGLYSRTTQASGSTVSNVTSSLFNLVFSNTSSSVFMSAVVTGYDTGSRQTVTGDIKSTIKYNAGVASVVGYNQKFINSEVANVNFDILASSVSASLLVYGSGSTTYKWGATITYQVI